MVVADLRTASGRLDLVALSPAFLTLSQAGAGAPGALDALGELVGAKVPAEWLEQQQLMRLRLGQLEADPTLAPWLLRAMVDRAERRMVGFIGFHTRPDAPYLDAHAPGGVELGYSVFARHRRQGYAIESCAAMIDWAHQTHGVERFVLSISPGNEPSLRLARRLGFVAIGEQLDDEDGRELIFLLTRSKA